MNCMKKIFTLNVLTMIVGMMLVGTQTSMAATKPSGGSVSGDVVISKVFYTGSTRLNGATPKNYLCNLYIELYNNSDKELELKGLYIALTNSDSNTNAWLATDMVKGDEMDLSGKAVVKQIFQISPDASYVVQPGQSVVIANCAIDHSEIAEGNVDLSNADFECKSTNKAYNFHSETVPELKVVKTFGTADFINMMNPGPCGIILLAADTDIAACATTYAKNKTNGNEYTIVPLYKSIDCVDIVKQKTPDAADKRILSDYDAGFTCTEDAGTFNAQAVVRKTAFVTSDGRTVLFDTNNSSVDFESTTDLSLRSYSKVPVGLNETMEITIPESGYLAINPAKPFCASKELTFAYVNVTNNNKTTDMAYYEFAGSDQLFIAGPWIAIGHPGKYTIKLSESQGTMRTRSSGMTWSEEDSKTLTGSQASRMIYKFQNTTDKVGFQRVAAVEGKYNVATFSDGDRLYYAITTAIADKIAEANGATDNTDLEFIAWHGAKPAAKAFEVEANNVAEFNAIETNKIVKFNLKDVRVNAFNPLFNLAYIEDESGISELNLKKTNISIKGGDILNGYIIGTKEVKDLDYMGNYPDMKEHVLNPGDYTSALTFSATEGTIEPVVATIAEAAKEGNHGRIMQISNFEVQTYGRFTYAVQGDDKIQLADDFMLYDLDYVWPTNIESIVGLVTYNGARWQISPISVESVVTGIQTISSNRSQSENMVIYNLQGVRMNSLQKGINIVNGRKVVIK